MKKLNPFKPFIVLLLTIMYVGIFLISCVLAGVAMVIPEMPTDKAIIVIVSCFVWIGFIVAVIWCHVIVAHNRQIDAANKEVNRAV